MNIQQILLSLLTGIILGGIFTLLKLPLPAPNALAGIIGIVGIYLGYLIVNYFIK